MRLDKYLCDNGKGSRSEVKKLIKSGVVTVNETVIKAPEYSVDAKLDTVSLRGETIQYQKYLYYILNKPKGVVTAVTDDRHPTVMSCIKDENVKGCSPVGRLDIDTEGLLLITNDGELAHKLLSPKNHVEKTYFAILNEDCPTKAVEMFKNGVDIGDEKLTLPARLEIGENPKEVRLTITEGRFHQVKRMFVAVGRKVMYLKRERMGNLTLGDLKPGEYSIIEPSNIKSLFEEKNG